MPLVYEEHQQYEHVDEQDVQLSEEEGDNEQSKDVSDDDGGNDEDDVDEEQMEEYPHPFLRAWDHDLRADADKLFGIQPKTLTELAMMRLSAALRVKPEWWNKRKDATIRNRWRQEALQSSAGLSERQVDYVLDELEGYDQLRDDDNGIQVSCCDGVWQSHTLIPAGLRTDLMREVAKLENVPEDQKDWHPNSDGQVLDLVHPSLYPFVFNRTIVIDNGELRTMPPPDGAEDDYTVSERFEWLPTQFDIDEDGQSATRNAYINNLHPVRDRVLSNHIQLALAKFAPLFDRVLTDLRHELPIRIPGEYTYTSYPRWPVPEEGEDPDSEELLEKFEAAKLENLVKPDVSLEGYTDGLLGNRETQVTLAGCTVDVIIKLANIHLTPEKPTYPGGSWHVEGMMNERIVASGIYYYDLCNVTESRLDFRMAVREPFYYGQNDDAGTRAVFGLDRQTPLNQEIGSVATHEGLCLAFPNIFQHRVAPFRLLDSTKPGHRKILVFFLVDPSISGIATSIVPPQQKEWILDALLHPAPEDSASPATTSHGTGARGVTGVSTRLPKSHLEKLSPEILQMIAEQCDGMWRSEAEEIRLELMKERSAFTSESDEHYFSVDFNMCEH